MLHWKLGMWAQVQIIYSLLFATEFYRSISKNTFLLNHRMVSPGSFLYRIHQRWVQKPGMCRTFCIYENASLTPQELKFDQPPRITINIFIDILGIKTLFIYVSPSVKTVLGYLDRNEPIKSIQISLLLSAGNRTKYSIYNFDWLIIGNRPSEIILYVTRQSFKYVTPIVVFVITAIVVMLYYICAWRSWSNTSLIRQLVKFATLCPGYLSWKLDFYQYFKKKDFFPRLFHDYNFYKILK